MTEKYKGSLGKVKTGKSSIGFKSLADVDLDTLTQGLRIARDYHEPSATIDP